MSKKRIYSKRKKINLIPVIIILAVAAIVFATVWGGSKLLSSKDYGKQIDEVFENDILKTTGSVFNVSKVNINVYSVGGIKYTNRHDDIVKINSFDSTLEEDATKASDAKALLQKITTLSKEESKTELLTKNSGYYWIRIGLTSNEKILFISNEENYIFDLYYDKEDKIIYVKEKYFDEFSMKNNTTKLIAYKADEESQKLIEDLAKSK